MSKLVSDSPFLLLLFSFPHLTPPAFSSSQKTRAALEEEKRSMETEKFLASFPQTPDWVLKAINQSGHGEVAASPMTPGFRGKYLSSAVKDVRSSPSAMRLSFDDESPTKSTAQRKLLGQDENTNLNA